MIKYHKFSEVKPLPGRYIFTTKIKYRNWCLNWNGTELSDDFNESTHEELENEVECWIEND